MEQQRKLRTYTKKERNMYLIGLAGQNITYNVINMLLASYYLQNVLYIPAAAVSTIITIARIWDAFNDPMMGTIVDKTRSKWGKCRPYLIYAPIVICVFTILPFINYSFDGNAGLFEGRNAFVIIWAAFTYIFWGMSYTVGDIPLWGIISLMTEDEKDRQKLISSARIFAGIGAGIAVLTLQPIALAVGNMLTEKLSDAHKGNQYGFIVVGVVSALIGYATFQLTGFFTREKIAPSKENYTIKQNFQIMWRNKPFRQILLSGVLSGPKQVMMIVAMSLVNYYYASRDPALAVFYLAFLGGGLFLGNLISMGLVPKLLTKMTKKNLYNYSNLIAVIPSILLFFVYLSAKDKMIEPIYMIISFIGFSFNGVSLGVSSVLQSTMISDAVDYEEYHYGIRPDGVFFSGQTFIAKLSSGIATIIYGICCQVVGFSGNNIKLLDNFIGAGGIPREAMMTTNPEFMPFITMLFFVITIPPAIGGLISVIPTWRYALDDDAHKNIISELNERRHAKDKAELELNK